LPDLTYWHVKEIADTPGLELQHRPVSPMLLDGKRGKGFSSPSNARLLAHNGEQPGIAVQRQHQKETSAVAGPSLLIMVCYRLRKSFHP
jgi:hypothetical protein